MTKAVRNFPTINSVHSDLYVSEPSAGLLGFPARQRFAAKALDGVDSVRRLDCSLLLASLAITRRYLDLDKSYPVARVEVVSEAISYRSASAFRFVIT